MYENKRHPLASRKRFYQRLRRTLLLSMCLLTVCLLIGVVGYHYWGDLSWIDSLHNAAMILSGMGPVAVISSNMGKLFSSFYAIFSGIAFISTMGIMTAPIVHRFFHKLHLEE